MKLPLEFTPRREGCHACIRDADELLMLVLGKAVTAGEEQTIAQALIDEVNALGKQRDDLLAERLTERRKAAGE